MLPTDLATVLDLLGVLLCLGGVVLSVWAALDDWIDRHHVRQDGVVGGPRWISATAHLRADTSLLIGWCAYLPLTLVAAYLPPRDSLEQIHLYGVPIGDNMAVLRLVFASSVLGAQIAWRVGRQQLRALPASAWDVIYGQARRFRVRWQEAEAENAQLRANEYVHRAEKHSWRNRAAAAELRWGLLQRWARRQGLVLPDLPALKQMDADDEGTPT